MLFPQAWMTPARIRHQLQEAVLTLQSNVLQAATADQRHNALTLKTVFGLALFSGVDVPDLLDAHHYQLNPAYRLDGESLPLLTFGYNRSRFKVPLITRLQADFQQVLNPNLLPEASLFGWRQCGRFVALHPDTLEHHSLRLGLPAGWWDWLPQHLRTTCPGLDWFGLRRRPPRLHQALADFNRTAARLAEDMEWRPAPEPTPETLPPRPNLQPGQHGLFTLAWITPRPGDRPVAQLRW